MTTAARYARFATAEAVGHSASTYAWATGIANDPELLSLIDQLPETSRQPNLILAAARLHGALIEGYATVRPWLLAHWPQIRATALTRTTQTNEAGRCATLLPLLASLSQPIALIEVGASAGLCLIPDRYAYRFNDAPILGPTDAPILPCTTTGPAPIPSALPTIAWRGGIDLAPIDVNDPAATAWLEALVWPEQTDRLARLRAAIAIARADPPRLIAGDLNTHIAALVAEAPAHATTVVFHTAVLAYLPPAARETFAATVRRLPCRWISNEAPDVFPTIRGRLPESPAPNDARFILALDGTPVARTGPHGQSLDWLP